MQHVTGSLTTTEVTTHPLTQSHTTTQAQSTQREKVLTMIGVLLVMLLASLDQTIVSTALPRIIADLHGFDRYTWVSTGYLLASTITVPIYGELSDVLGRKPIFLFGLVVFLAGSALSGTAQSMNALIAFRAFQGIGAGALLPIAIAVVGDLFTPRERGRWQGITGAVFGLSSIIGPLIGGFITQNFSWHWVFYVNLPIGIVAMLALIFLMPMLRPASQRPVTIDYIGAALLIVGTLPLLLGFTWAGSLYAWLSPQIIGTFALAIVALIAFVFYELYLERRGKQPILEPTLFTNNIFSISILVTVFSGFGLFGAIFFVPLFVQSIIGLSATESGFVLTPLLLTAVLGSIVVGQLVARFGKYKVLAIIGLICSTVGSLLLLRLNVQATIIDVLIALLVMGIGMGFSMALYSVIVQNALPTKIGQATAALTFFRSIGQTIGLAIMGSILTTSYRAALNQSLPASVKQSFPASLVASFNNPEVLNSPTALQSLQAQVAKLNLGSQGTALLNQALQAIKVALSQSIFSIFLLSSAVMFISLIFVFFLKEIPLTGRSTVQRQEATTTAAQAGNA